ncbi:MAG: hypothetical protein ACOWWR_19700 [Eubacteriales bacterium]
MNKKILIYLCVLLIIFGTSCTNKDVIEENTQNSKKIKELESTITQLQEEIDTYKEQQIYDGEERDFYLNFIKNLMDYLSEEEQIKLAQSQWKYHILIDEDPIPVNGTIEISKDNFKLTVIEEQNPFTALPDEIHVKGRISGSLFSNHIKFLNTKPNETTGEDGTIVSSTIYTFNNLTADSIINLEVSAELQQILGLNTNIITIKILDVTSEDESVIENEENEKEE